MINTLIVDDDFELVELISKHLHNEGCKIYVAHNAKEAKQLLNITNNFDIIILDVMLPDTTGFELLFEIRKTMQIPVIMLTARGDKVDRVTGLNLGADDYIAKPFALEELTARMNAVLRRVTNGNNTDTDNSINTSTKIVETGNLKIWPNSRKALWQGQSLSLTSTQFNLLLELARNAGEIVTKSSLSERALGKTLKPHDRSIDVHISSIRRKLGIQADGSPWILNIHGHGYQMLKE